jgi:hypothetical protein
MMQREQDEFSFAKEFHLKQKIEKRVHSQKFAPASAAFCSLLLRGVVATVDTVRFAIEIAILLHMWKETPFTHAGRLKRVEYHGDSAS